MATLRDPIFGLNNAPTAEWRAAEIEAQRPNSLRGGWEAGRLGTEVNALNADISSLRASGDAARADAMQREADALRQQQANVAPRIGRLEDINGVGDAFSWAAGQMGQGTASMVEPVAAATAVGGVGALMGMAPGGIGAAGRALRNFGAPAAAYGINQRQLKGEFYGSATQDEELMARTSPQDLNNTAEMYGAGAALLDTAPHAILGRMFTGGLRKGLGMGAGATALLGMTGEGATEAAQSYASQETRGYLNPNRDTSGDFMENVNAGAGGFMGSGPISGAGAMADAGYRRVGVAAEQIGAKAGDVIDLAREGYEGSALQGGVDRAMDGMGKAMGAGKQKAGDLMDLARDDDGNISLARIAEAAGAARDSVQEGAQDLVQRYKVSTQEQDLLDMVPPAGLEQDQTKHDAWFGEAGDKRAQFVSRRIVEMSAADPQAADIRARLAAAPDYEAQQAIVDEGAAHILQNNELEQLQTRAERAAAAAGEFAMKGAGVVGKGAVAAGKAALGFGKAVFDGAAGEMRKKNEQSETTPYDEWVQRRDQMRGGALPIEEQGKRHAAANRVLDAEAIRRDPKKAQAMERSRRRAELFGEILEAEARSARAVFATRADPAVEDAFGLITRHAGYELADIADSWGMNGPKQQGGVGLNAGTRQSPVLTMALDRITNSLRVALRDRAAPAIDELQAQADPGAAPLFDYVRERLTASATPAGRKAAEATRSNVANEMMLLVPDARRAEIMGSEAKGGKLNRAWLLESVEALANGHESPRFRATLDEAFGKDVVSQMIGVVSDVLPAPPKLMAGNVYDGGVQGEGGVNEDGEYENEMGVDQASSFETRQAEKNVSKGMGPKVYGFAHTAKQSLRGSNDRRDPFSPVAKMSEKERLAVENENLQRAAEGLEPLAGAPIKRPGLFKLTDTLFVGNQNALQKKIADMEKTLGIDRTPERMAATMEKEGEKEGAARVRAMAADSTRAKELAADVKSFFVNRAGSHVVGARSAAEVMKDLNFQPAKILSVYRDYLRQDAAGTKLTDAERKDLKAQANMANRAVMDAMDQGAGKEGKVTFRLTAGERRAVQAAAQAYFKERYVAVAEQLSSRDQSRIEITEVLNMARAGAQAVASARMDRDDPGVQGAALDEANLITFQSDLMGTEKRGLHIPAERLVKWVQAQREQSQKQGKSKPKEKRDEFANSEKNKEFLADLMEGIGAVMASGLVDEKLPTRINAKGDYEAFAKGIPKSLRLATMTYGSMQHGKKQRLEGIVPAEPIAGPPNKNDPDRDATRDDEYQLEVGIDQARGEEPYVVDPLETIEPRPNGERQARQLTTKIPRDLGLPADGRRANGPIRVDRSGVQYADPKTDGDNATPLDFSEGQKFGAVPDEYSDQQFRSKDRLDGIAPEPKMSAAQQAPKRAADIVQALRKDFAKGVAMLESRLRTAQRPEYIQRPMGKKPGSLDMRGAEGGVHYLFPVAHALGLDTIASLDLTPAEAKQLQALRAETAAAILAAPKLSESRKIALTKAMTTAAAADKVTMANYARALQKAAAAAQGVDEVGNVPSPFSPEHKDVSRKPLGITKREDGKSEGVREKGDPSLPAKALIRTRKHAEKFDGNVDQMITAIERKAVGRGPQAPQAAQEVAAVGAPKSQPKPGGVEGRKLNAQTFSGKGGRPVFTDRIPGNEADQKLVEKLNDHLPRATSRRLVVHPAVPNDPAAGRVRRIAGRFGKRVVWVEGLGTDGVYWPSASKGVVFLDPDSGRSASVLVAHELAHTVERERPDIFDALVDALRPHLDGGQWAAFVRRQQAGVEGEGGEPLTPHGLRAEMVANLMADYAHRSFAEDNRREDAARGVEFSGYGAYLKPGAQTAVDAAIGRALKDAGQSRASFRNAQGPTAGNARVAAQAEMDEAKAYVKKVLGPQIKVEFKDITGYSGEWLDAEQAIHISTTAAAGILSTAYHESLHGFFSKFVKNDERVMETLKSLAENEKILQRVAALLAKHPAALDQLKSGEERLAYIYQFWAAGKLDLPMGKARTVLQKVRKFFRRVLGLVKDSERAVALFEAFHGGQLAQPSAAGKVIAGILDEGTGALKMRRSMDGVSQWLAAKTMPAETLLATSDSKAAKALAKEFFTNPGDGTVGKEAEGYLNARRRMALRYNNTFASIVDKLSDRDMAEVARYLQQEAELSDIAYAPHREAVGKIRNLLQRFYRYMSDERGLDLGHAGEKYYPRVWNTALLHQKKDQFVAMLTEHYDTVLEQGAQGSKGKLSKEQVAERIWRALINREGVNDKLDAQRQDGVLSPFFASKENRTLAWLQGEHAEPFLEKGLAGTLSRYFHQGVRAAEYTDRFGADGEHLEKRLLQVHAELVEASHVRAKRKEFKDEAARTNWVKRQYRDVAEAVGAMEGTLGKDISPGMRKLNSYTTVYQNVRLLPLSLFASFVDPLGMVARGATMKEAYDGFLRGMKEVVRTWGDMFREEPKERQADQWEKLAEHVGAVDAAMFSHHVSDEYSSVYMERGAKKVNDAMFKLNGMEAWNRGMRVAGTKSAVKFIERHSRGEDKVHSARWLQELGLDPDNIPLDSEGNLITDKSVLMSEKGVGKAQAEREIDAVHYAINRWVEGAVLTPNAAQRPPWGSDPHYSMFFHLKQFSYSFHQTIMKRAVQEMNHGNLAPLGVFAWYIPAMIAADITKGLIQGGGELPTYMKAYDAGDWVMHGVQRAGVLGVGTLGVDAQADVFSLAGPAAEQMVDAMVDPLERTMIKAAPAHGLYAEALR